MWIATIFPALVIGLSGLSKLITSGEWDRLFPSWGYPAWFAVVVGATELVGVVMTCVPRLAAYGAVVLTTIMTGAAITLFRHPGSHYFRGRQGVLDYREPLVYAIILVGVAWARWNERVGSRRATTAGRMSPDPGSLLGS